MIYISLLLVSIVLMLWLFLFSWQHRRAPGVLAFAVMCLFGAFWLLVVTLMLLAPSGETALFWYRTSFISVSLLPVLLLVFIVQYRGMRLFTPARLGLLLLIPCITQAAVWTDSRFHFFFRTVTITVKNDLMVLHSWTPGPWFTIHSIYSFLVSFTALLLLFIYAVRQFRFFQGQSIAFIAGALVVVLPNLAFALGLIPPDIIVLPFCFLLMGLCFAWAIFRHKLFEIVPVARNTMVEIMSDGMIVLDTGNRVVDINPAARATLSLTGKDVIGRYARQIFSPWPDLVTRFADAEWTHTEISLPAGNDTVHYDVRITSLVDRKKQPAGRLVLFSDITERKRIEKEKDRLLADLNQKNAELERLYGMALDANPMTGLPGNNSVADAIADALSDDAQVCVIYTDLDNFKAFNDKYGFALGDEVIRFTADLLNRSLALIEGGRIFIGHIGGDDFVLIVPTKKTKATVDFIIHGFDDGITGFYNEEDRSRGFISSKNRKGKRERFPIMSISLAGIDLSRKRYREYIEVNDACAGLKKKAKKIPGSTFCPDRRTAAPESG